MQVVFGGDPEAALIQYTKNEEARRAISSTEAVLNNRFIRVYWHREPGANSTGLQQQEQSTGSQAAGSAQSQGPQHSNLNKVIMKIWNTLFAICACFHTNKLYLHLTAFLKPFLINFLYIQGIKQHNAAAYVLNKTLPKHRLPATAGTTATTKTDSLTSNTDTVTVRYSPNARSGNRKTKTL